MMLVDLVPSLPLQYDDCRTMALVFAPELLTALEDVQDDTTCQHQAQPAMLTDGRCLLCGDLLSEVGPGGLYAATLGRLDPSLFSQIEVMPWGDAVTLLPSTPDVNEAYQS